MVLRTDASDSTACVWKARISKIGAQGLRESRDSDRLVLAVGNAEEASGNLSQGHNCPP
jgi:hypothetical protein